jgi:hypothetical protein
MFWKWAHAAYVPLALNLQRYMNVRDYGGNGTIAHNEEAVMAYLKAVSGIA